MQSQESVFSERKVSVFRAVTRLSSILAARSTRIVLSFPSALDAEAAPAKRNEKTMTLRMPFRMPFETARDFIAGLPSRGDCRDWPVRHANRNYKCRAKPRTPWNSVRYGVLFWRPPGGGRSDELAAGSGLRQLPPRDARQPHPHR